MNRNRHNQIPHPAFKTKQKLSQTGGHSILKYVTNIIGEPKYKYGQQEQVTVRNHNRSTALERSVLKYWEA